MNQSFTFLVSPVSVRVQIVPGFARRSAAGVPLEVQEAADPVQSRRSSPDAEPGSGTPERQERAGA